MKNTTTGIFIIFYLSLILPGCASYPITGYDLRDNPHGKVEFSANEDYLTVYRRIMLASVACYGDKPFRVDGKLLKEKNAAEITIASINIVYIAALYISIKAASNNTTSVITYYAPGLNNEWEAVAEHTKQWAKGNTDGCR
jgi:hypothetical protein